MSNSSENNQNLSIQSAYDIILNEHINLYHALNFNSVAPLEAPIKDAKQIFLIGAGRTGFMVKAATMRLMHLGYKVHVVGETTTPAIGKNDLLIAVSGSGTTKSILNAAETASKNEAEIACFTTNDASPLAKLSNYTVVIPAAGKQEHANKISQQYAGSLFEQGFLLLFDALIQYLWKQSDSSAEQLWEMHANME
ncbi:6-phospho-3-hexuloisomerase [Zunongwangia atlantica]|uniref:6-phospho 3-hexuloisomerase n=1 Tax=Zunongwangia atlantica 22II14-10F7 TaxID=1185767 RepID=A0A1Y1T8J4_9FLAO|nr:6-phospho-3-hexuloisomerase [Zunongwangia atlantica]ORL47381.1 6-phospho 3-hexuloisomerase [Zunongwangia atlantica 22II14-10F7]